MGVNTIHLKFLAGATLIVFLWFLTRVGMHPESRAHIEEIVYNSISRPLGPFRSQADGQAKVLSEEEAIQFCSNHRLPAFPQERVAGRKVYDLLLINTEIEMLEIRMGQMAPYVDYFVILESDRTFTDHQKPLYVAENWDRFAPWHNQMIRHTIDLDSSEYNQDTWGREQVSRNAMYFQVIPHLVGGQKATIDDVLLVSDVDEIFKPETVKALRNCETPSRVTITSRMYYYSFQWLSEWSWRHPQATTYQGDETIMPDDLRSGPADLNLPDGAWHCSYCFSTVEELITKITSFSHTEMDRPEFKDPEKILNRVRNGIDMFERDNKTRIENNVDVPQYIKAKSQQYSFLLDRDPADANFKDYHWYFEEPEVIDR